MNEDIRKLIEELASKSEEYGNSGRYEEMDVVETKISTIEHQCSEAK